MSRIVYTKRSSKYVSFYIHTLLFMRIAHSSAAPVVCKQNHMARPDTCSLLPHQQLILLDRTSPFHHPPTPNWSNCHPLREIPQPLQKPQNPPPHTPPTTHPVAPKWRPTATNRDVVSSWPSRSGGPNCCNLCP